MHIQLSPVTHEFNNCFQGQIETIVEEYYHKNYLLTQFCRWSTDWDVVNGKIERVSEKGFFNADELEQIGITQVVETCKNNQEMIKKIKQELSRNILVMAGIQVTNCPWDPNYRKQFEMEHIIILNGWNQEKNAFICCDATYNKQNVLLPVEEFETGCTNEYRKLVEFSRYTVLSEQEMDLLLTEKAEELISGKDFHFERLERLGAFLMEYAGTINKKETNLDKVLFSKEYMVIRDCVKTREMLVFMLDSKNGEEDRILKELFKLCMKKWLKIRNLYVRAVTVQDAECYWKRIGTGLHEVKEIEERIAGYIVYHDKNLVEAYLNGEEKRLIGSLMERRGESEKPRIINLKSIYNNKAFGKFEDGETARFSSMGEYMIAPQEGYFCLFDNKEKFYLDIPEGMDNVLCKGQKIEVFLKNVTELLIIGTTELGGEKEELILKLDSGEERRFMLDFPEWYTEIISDESLIMQQKVVAREADRIVMTSFSGKIFLKKYYLSGEAVTGIRFPEDGRVHIFQIAAYTRS